MCSISNFLFFFFFPLYGTKQEEIEAEYLKKEESYSLKIDVYDYLITFDDKPMCQSNMDSGTMRQVRRRPLLTKRWVTAIAYLRFIRYCLFVCLLSVVFINFFSCFAVGKGFRREWGINYRSGQTTTRSKLLFVYLLKKQVISCTVFTKTGTV